MTDADRDAATDALMAWFESQEIEPADAGLVMFSVIAACLLDKTKDVSELAGAVNCAAQCIAAEIADQLRNA